MNDKDMYRGLRALLDLIFIGRKLFRKYKRREQKRTRQATPLVRAHRNSHHDIAAAPTPVPVGGLHHPSPERQRDLAMRGWRE